MRIFTFLFIMILSVSCASKPHYKAQEYVDSQEVEIPIFFTTSRPTMVGYCQLNPDLNKRVVYISRQSWNQFPSKREKYVSDLLTMCYYTKRNHHDAYFDLHYYGH